MSATSVGMAIAARCRSVATWMGTRPEDGAVVDPSGSVHGSQRLNVTDASIMPDAPSGFTHLPIIMIAERLAEDLASQL